MTTRHAAVAGGAIAVFVLMLVVALLVWSLGDDDEAVVLRRWPSVSGVLSKAVARALRDARALVPSSEARPRTTTIQPRRGRKGQPRGPEWDRY